MVIRVVIVGEGRGVTGEREVEGQVANWKPLIAPFFCDGGVGENGLFGLEIASENHLMSGGDKPICE